MIAAKVREAVNARPFSPFTIVMGDGTRYRVTHPEMVAIAPKAERTCIVALGEEEHAVIDLLLVVSLEFRSRNGQHRKAS